MNKFTSTVICLAASSIFAADPLAYWRFETANGTNVIDSTGNGFDGNINGLPTYQTDVPVDPVPGTNQTNARSLNFNWQSSTSGGRINIQDPQSQLGFGNQSFTIEAWVKLDELSNTSNSNQRQYLLQKKANSGADSILDYAILAQAGNLGSSGNELAFRYGNGQEAFTVLSTLEVTDTSWHHVSVAYDKANGKLRFGIDGSFDLVDFEKPNLISDGPLRVGAHQNTSAQLNHFLRGSIDELRIDNAFLPENLLLDTNGEDCNGNGVADVIDISNASSNDCNANCIPDECDIASGTSEDCQGDQIPDDCQLGTFRYAWDDGEGDAAVRSEGTRMAWLNSFTAQAGFETVTGIDLALFDGFSGRPASLCVWSDPDGDGIPLDAEPLIVHPVALRDGIIDLNENSLFDIPDTYVGPAGTSFFIGIVLDFEVTGSDFPARYDFNDQPPVPFVSWVIGATAPIDPSDLFANSVEFQLVEDAGLPPGNWVLQAVVGGSDCDGNSIPDDCDVANGAPDCNNNLLPDACELPTQDCNLNGLLDDCDILDGTSQDLDGDNIPDECPLTFIDVPALAPTIQAAITAAGTGTTVRVADGTYVENINLLGKAITLTSVNGPMSTIIDGSNGGPTVEISALVGPDTVVEGFTITGGTGRPSDGGGGILILGSPTIRGNIIRENHTDGYGGGILAFGPSSPTIINNTIENNSALKGGGFHAQVDNTLSTMSNNIIRNNACTEDNGGGIYFQNGTLYLSNNQIVGNTAPDSGGGVFVVNSGNLPSQLIGNQIVGNQSGSNGGGLWMRTSNPVIANNLIHGNSSESGGGVFLEDSGSFINNTVVNNSGSLFGGGIFSNGSSYAISNSIVRDNNAPGTPDISGAASLSITYSNITGGASGTGNIDADPLFVDPSMSDYRLHAGSPSNDAGSNFLLPNDELDLDGDSDVTELLPYDLSGNPRQTDDSSAADTGEGSAPIVDMGAFELSSGCPEDLDGNGEINFNDLLLLLAAWGNCPGCPEDIDGSGDVGFSDTLLLLAAWGTCS